MFATKVSAAKQISSVLIRPSRFLTGAAMAATCCIASVSMAIPPVVLVDSNGFESPTFDAGGVVGQDGWAGFVSGPATATVETTMPFEGSQSLHVTRGASSHGSWAKPIASAPGAGSKIIQIQWEMNYELLEQADHPNSFGPFFGVQAFDDVSAPEILDIATLGVDSTTRDVLITDGPTGAYKETGFQLTDNEWHNFNLVLDFNTSLYTAFVDGQKLAQESFVDNSAFSAVSTAMALSDADIVAREAAGDPTSLGLVNEAFFDNFTITQGLAADFDDDGDVDEDDLGIWETAFDAATSAGDADGDGNSTGSDFLIWQNQFGIDLVSAPPALAAVAGVPEPSSVALAMFAAAGLTIRYVRRRRA